MSDDKLKQQIGHVVDWLEVGGPAANAFKTSLEAGGVREVVAMRHATEFGIGLCAQLNVEDGRLVYGRAAERILRSRGLRSDTRACDGMQLRHRDYERKEVVLSMLLVSTVPSCPKCAVLRDEALASLTVAHLARAQACGVR